ncbi:hypothetical protein GCM10022252_45140 [Streptosporangium oxazolinicum]|uniref:Uncharacterized protein n=1 Tax=Streptosporangium oxazolinicum TaxID=909287 RepID=A0ABP8B3F3_9ACTN
MVPGRGSSGWIIGGPPFLSPTVVDASDRLARDPGPGAGGRTALWHGDRYLPIPR